MNLRPGLDPRLYQIGVLTTLLVYGLTVLEFPLAFDVVIGIALGALGLQWLAAWWSGTSFEMRSALISVLSLAILLRTDVLWIGVLAGLLAIGSKFAFRSRGKHLFNPTNFALVLCTACLPEAWISYGQWGANVYVALFLAGAGLVVLTQASRLDITLAFLGFYAGALVARAVWLGDPLSIPLHQLQGGSLLIFAFFMISDPRSTPDSRAGRIVFAALAAGTAIYVQFWMYSPNGLFYGLLGASLATP